MECDFAFLCDFAEQDRKLQEDRKRSPLPIFFWSIGLVLLLAGVTGFLMRGDHGEPPWPGAVYSEAHGHWH